MNKYKVIAICGKSAAGKDTFLRHFMIACPHLHKIINCTTRPPREGEVNGKDYYFLTVDEFARLEKIECAQFREWYYGTSLDTLDINTINIGVFNPRSILQLADCDNIDLFVVQVVASDKMRLLRSLNREQNPDIDEIVRRYLADKEDFTILSRWYEPDYIVENNGQGIDPTRAQKIAKNILAEAESFWAKETN